MKATPCTLIHQDQQGFSNDIKSVAKGVMIWEISM
jgi:hypothetical protein